MCEHILSRSLCVVPCAPVSVNVTTVLYQNNSVYDVELFWTHRQQVIIDCCDVLKHDVFLHTELQCPSVHSDGHLCYFN